MSASAVVAAITVLEPLVEKLAGYLDDRHNDIPEVPGVLASDIELARLKERAKKTHQK